MAYKAIIWLPTRKEQGKVHLILGPALIWESTHNFWAQETFRNKQTKKPKPRKKPQNKNKQKTEAKQQQQPPLFQISLL